MCGLKVEPLCVPVAQGMGCNPRVCAARRFDNGWSCLAEALLQPARICGLKVQPSMSPLFHGYAATRAYVRLEGFMTSTRMFLSNAATRAYVRLKRGQIYSLSAFPPAKTSFITHPAGPLGRRAFCIFTRMHPPFAKRLTISPIFRARFGEMRQIPRRSAGSFGCIVMHRLIDIIANLWYIV